MDPTPDPPSTTPDPPSATGPEARPRPYPVVLRLDGARCLVVGAGPVAARKVAGLLEAGASVTVVAPSVGAGLRALADDAVPVFSSLAVEVRPYRPPEASGYVLVVSATGDPAVDARVASDARAGGALVNRADTAADPAGRDAVGAGGGAGTVLLPAVHRVGSVTVAVSTDGSSPALARWLRDRVAVGLADADVGTLAELVDRTRAALRSAGGDGPPVDWATVLDRVAPLVAVGRVDRARELLAELTGTAIRST